MAAATESAAFTFAVKESPHDHGTWYIMLEADADGLKSLPEGFFSLQMRAPKSDRQSVEELASRLNAMVATLSFTDMRGSDDAFHVEDLLRNLPKS